MPPKYSVPLPVVRSTYSTTTGNDGLKSVFVAVYDMYRNGAKIKSVERLEAGADSVALKVNLGARTDVLLLSLEGPAAMSAGGVNMNGKLGLVSRIGDAATARLIGGTKLQAPNVGLSADRPAWSGTILAATRKYDGAAADTFTVQADLPTGKVLHGSWMVVRHPGADVTHGYEIGRVEARDGKTVVHLKADHGLRIKGQTTQEVFSQWKTFKGLNTFAITTRASGG